MIQNTLRRDDIVLRHICTGCTVCRSAMDGKERRMYRMYGMSRCHEWQRATNVQDVRYVLDGTESLLNNNK